MPVTYRSASVEDLAAADELVVSSINAVTSRHGYGPIASPAPTLFQAFCLQVDPDGLWVAEEDGRLLGFAWSWTSDDLWFLAQLFVSPDAQDRGIGGELLRRTEDQAARRGASV